MVSSTRSVLFSLLQSKRFANLGHKLKAFILRCLTFWPRILRNLREFWFWFFQTSSSSGKETEGSTGWPSSSRALRDHEGHNVICASRAFDMEDGQSMGRSLSRRSGAEESIQLGAVSGGVSHSPSSSFIILSTIVARPSDAFNQSTHYRRYQQFFKFIAARRAN